MRREELESYCAEQVLNGRTQKSIGDELGYSKSSISRFASRGIQRLGDPTLARHMKTRAVSLPQMMWHRIDVRGQDECWPWIGAIKQNGYGLLNFKGVAFHAHRLVYETLLGAIPDGHVVDHICRNRRCVNPRHLQAVTQSQNLIFASTRRRRYGPA